jgi:hypothetical protein
MRYILLAFLLAGCSSGIVQLPEEGRLSIISPLESADISGGGELRIALTLVDQDDLLLEGAVVQAELWHPEGRLFAELPCEDRGSGSYVAETVSLPLRGSSGIWRIAASATWPNGRPAEIASTIHVGLSISETYLERHGFWVEYPRIFGLGTGFHNLHETGGLHFEDWVHPDGSGYVILDNYRYGTIGITFATLEVHWQGQDFPADAAAAVAFAESLAESGFHHQELDVPLKDLSAEETTFHGRTAWQIMGTGSEFYVSLAGGDYPVEWTIFECPDSDWLWALVIFTDDAGHMDHLRAVRSTFECPAAGSN